MSSFLFTFHVFLPFLVSIQGDLTKIVDLSWDFNNETIYWVGISPFKYTKKVGDDQERGYWYAMNEFCAGEHGGTHFDAPYHFNKAGWKVREIPVQRLVAKGACLDLGETETSTLNPEHLEAWTRKNGPFEDNTVLIVRFGRSRFWPNRTLYLGVGDDGKMGFPGLSREAADWIAGSGKIVGVGVDTPSLDPGSSEDFQAHRILSAAQIYGMENVKILEELPARGFVVVALPMKLEEGTGAPLRILAVPKGFSLNHMKIQERVKKRILFLELS